MNLYMAAVVVGVFCIAVGFFLYRDDMKRRQELSDREDERKAGMASHAPDGGGC